MRTFPSRPQAALVLSAGLSLSCLAGASSAQVLPHGFDGDVQISVPSTPSDPCETYYMRGPAVVPIEGAPLLVLFHSYYSHHTEHAMLPGEPHNWDYFDLITEAHARGWFVMMHDGGQYDGDCNSPQPCTPHPAGGYFTTYGIEAFHRHTEAAIADALQRFPINRDRVFGYGFSMGGHEVLNYTARHLDPTSGEGMFAAVISSSGYVSPIHEEICNGNSFANCFYNRAGTPRTDYCDPSTSAMERFWWKRAGVMTLYCGASCTSTSAFQGVAYWDSQIQNIALLPIRLYYDMHEVPEVKNSNDYLDSWLGGGAREVLDCSQPPPSCPGVDCYDSTTGNYNPHQWDTVCARLALDFLAPHTLKAHLGNVAGSGLVLCAENDRRYLHFRVKRANTNDFGRIQWSTAPNQINLDSPSPPPGHGPYVANVNEVVVVGDAPGIGSDDPLAVLDTTAVVRVQTSYGLASLGVSGYDNGPPQRVIYDNGTTQVLVTNWTFINGTVAFHAGIGTYTIIP